MKQQSRNKTIVITLGVIFVLLATTIISNPVITGQNIGKTNYSSINQENPRNEINIIEPKTSAEDSNEYYWWKCNDGSGSTICDYGSATTNNITLINSPSWVSGGAPNGWDCIDFERDNSQYGDSTSNMGVSGNDNRSLTFWFKSEVLAAPPSSYSHSVGYGSHSGTGGYGSYLHNNGDVAVWCGDTQQAGIFNLDDTNWHFIAITHDGSNTKYYKDDQYVGQLTGSLSTINDAMSLGRDPSFSGRYWDGYLSDIRFFDTVISSDAIDWLYNGGNGRVNSLSDRGGPEYSPEISNVVDNPKSPNSTDVLTISADVFDQNGDLDTILLYYKINFGSWQYKLMNSGGGDSYSTTIGPYSENTVIKYYIYANDSLNNEKKMPTYAPTHYYEIKIGELADPAWKKSLRESITSLKQNIDQSIQQSILFLSEMIATTINDSLDYGIGFIIGKIVDGLGRGLFAGKLAQTDKDFYNAMRGSSSEEIDAFIDMIWHLVKENPEWVVALTTAELLFDDIADFLTSGIFTNTNQISTFLKYNELVEAVIHYQEIQDEINLLLSNFLSWLNSLPNEVPNFDLVLVLGIIESINHNIELGMEGNASSFALPDGTSFPTPQMVNLKRCFDVLHFSLDITNTFDYIVDIISIVSGALTVIGGPIVAVSGPILGVSKVAGGILKFVKLGFIIAEVTNCFIALMDFKEQLENFREILTRSIEFIQDNYNTPINYDEIKIEIIDIKTPNQWPSLTNEAANGTITIKNTGTEDTNVVIATTIRTPDNQPLYRYYYSIFLTAGQEQTLDTYYFGHESDLFGFSPYSIEFKVFAQGKYMTIKRDFFYVGLSAILNDTANRIIDFGNFLIEQGETIWTDITTAIDDFWTTIWGGDAQSDVDLRLWNENRSIMLVGYNYTLNETVNLIGADYSGSNANPEYIRISNPTGTNYSLEIVGVDLPYQENTTVSYMNTGRRNATLGVQNQIKMTRYFFPGNNGSITAFIPIMESSYQNNLTNLKINSTDLSYSGNFLSSLSEISNVNLSSGEVLFLLLNYSYFFNVIEGNYTGKIKIWNGTSLLREINLTVNILDVSRLQNINLDYLPNIGLPTIPTATPIAGTNVLIKVIITDDNIIDKVYILYSINSNSWITAEMSETGTNEYSFLITGQAVGTMVQFLIYAFNNESYMQLSDNNGQYYSLVFMSASADPGDEFDLIIIIIIIMTPIGIVAAVSVLFLRHRKIIKERR